MEIGMGFRPDNGLKDLMTIIREEKRSANQLEKIAETKVSVLKEAQGKSDLLDIANSRLGWAVTQQLETILDNPYPEAIDDAIDDMDLNSNAVRMIYRFVVGRTDSFSEQVRDAIEGWVEEQEGDPSVLEAKKDKEESASAKQTVGVKEDNKIEHLVPVKILRGKYKGYLGKVVDQDTESEMLAVELSGTTGENRVVLVSMGQAQVIEAKKDKEKPASAEQTVGVKEDPDLDAEELGLEDYRKDDLNDPGKSAKSKTSDDDKVQEVPKAEVDKMNKVPLNSSKNESLYLCNNCFQTFRNTEPACTECCSNIVEKIYEKEFLASEEDVSWLLDTHLKGVDLPQIPKSYVLYGNEDSPDKIELYAKHNPSAQDNPYAVYVLDNDFDSYKLLTAKSKNEKDDSPVNPRFIVYRNYYGDDTQLEDFDTAEAAHQHIRNELLPKVRKGEEFYVVNSATGENLGECNEEEDCSCGADISPKKKPQTECSDPELEDNVSSMYSLARSDGLSREQAIQRVAKKLKLEAPDVRNILMKSGVQEAINRSKTMIKEDKTSDIIHRYRQARFAMHDSFSAVKKAAEEVGVSEDEAREVLRANHIIKMTEETQWDEETIKSYLLKKGLSSSQITIIKKGYEGILWDKPLDVFMKDHYGKDIMIKTWMATKGKYPAWDQKLLSMDPKVIEDIYYDLGGAGMQYKWVSNSNESRLAEETQWDEETIESVVINKLGEALGDTDNGYYYSAKREEDADLVYEFSSNQAPNIEVHVMSKEDVEESVDVVSNLTCPVCKSDLELVNDTLYKED